MSKKISLFILALMGILAGLNAQETKGVYLKLSHFLITDTIAPTVEEFSLKGAEILIEGNEVSLEYAAEPAKNRTFEFDRIKGFEFELRSSTAIGKVKIPVPILRAFVDGAGMLQVEAEQPLGQVNVYTAAGALVASQKTGDKRTQINLSSATRGIYIVQAGANRLLIIKH